MDQDRKLKLQDLIPKVIVKFGQAAQNKTGLELSADEMEAFVLVSQSFNQLDKPTALSLEDFPELIGAPDQTPSFPPEIFAPPLPNSPAAFQVFEPVKPTFKVLQAFTLEDYEALINELTNSDSTFHFAGNLMQLKDESFIREVQIYPGTKDGEFWAVRKDDPDPEAETDETESIETE